jgi:hypothetical protein
MLMRKVIVAASVAVVFAAGGASAAPKESNVSAPPAAITRVNACRSIAAAAERLACFDREVAAMAAAQAKGDLVAMDRQQVRRTKRSLFGLALPDLGVFGDSDSIEGDATSLETTIRRVVQNADGKYVFTLAEGGRWQQLDSRNFIVDPAPGQTIRIRQAAMGSYLANVNKQNAIRVRRIQ